MRQIARFWGRSTERSCERIPLSAPIDGSEALRDSLAMKMNRSTFAMVSLLALLSACDNAPQPNQPAGADCNASLNDACAEGHYCARAESGEDRNSNGGFAG